MILAPLVLALPLQSNPPPGGADPLPAIQVARPRDPWVFRSVLDGKPRMVTIALSDEMWLAYDATNCGLAKAWKGGVKFDGPVYTTVHGPQPTSAGPSYTEGFEGPVWEAFVADRPAESTTVWRGYRFAGDHVALLYEVRLADGRRIEVQESPEFVRPETLFDAARREELVLPEGCPGLLRSFHAGEMPEDVKLTVRVRMDGAAKLDEGSERTRFVDVEGPDGEMRTQIVSHLYLTRRKPASNLILFFRPLPEPPAERAAGEEAK